MLRTGGNRDQLVRLANGGRLVDGVAVASAIFFFPITRLVDSLGD